MTVTRTPPAIVTNRGDIVIHGRATAVISVEFLDEDGAPRSMAGRVLYFEIAGLDRFVVPEGDDETSRVLIVPRALFEAIGVGAKAAFALIDETVEAAPEVVWAGAIGVEGFVGEPP